MTRAAGRSVVASFVQVSGESQVGFEDSSFSLDGAKLYALVDGTAAEVDSVSAGEQRHVAVVHRTAGDFYSDLESEKLLWVDEASSGDAVVLVGSVSTEDGVAHFDDIAVVDLGITDDTGLLFQALTSPATDTTATMTPDALVVISVTTGASGTDEFRFRIDDATNFYDLEISSGNHAEIYEWVDGSAEQRIRHDGSTQGAHVWVVAWDGEMLRLYLDGVQVGSYDSAIYPAATGFKYQAKSTGGSCSSVKIWQRDTSALGVPPGAMQSMSPGLSIDVTETGAVIDGATDDYAACESALAAVARFGDAVNVTIPSGTLALTRGLLVRSNTTVSGAGMSDTILKNPSGSMTGHLVNGNNLYATIGSVAANNVTIRDLKVDHTSGTESNGISFIPDGEDSSGDPCSNCRIIDCAVDGHDSHQYLVWSQRGQNITVSGCSIDGKVNPINESSQQEGIEVFGGENVVISGNTVVDVGSNGIYLTSSAEIADCDLTACEVSGNTITDGRRGINCAMNAKDVISDLTISGNTVNGQTVSAIQLTLSETGPVVESVLIDDNEGDGQAGNAIVVVANDYPDCSEITVSNNTFTGAVTTATVNIVCPNVVQTNNTLLAP